MQESGAKGASFLTFAQRIERGKKEILGRYLLY